MEEKTIKRNTMIMIAVLLILFFVALFVEFMYLKDSHPESEYEKNINKITEISKEEQQEYLNQLVEDGMMNVRYSMGTVFKGKVSKSFSVKNNPNNHHPIVFKLYGENGDLLYESKKIKPGFEMTAIELLKDLQPGNYDGSIVIGYAEEGNVSSSFPINIKVE